MSRRPTHSSRQRYTQFVEDYKHARTEDARGSPSVGTPGATDAAPEPAEPRRTTTASRVRSAHVGDYMRWLRPQRGAVSALLVLALANTGLEMLSPLLMRFIIDRVLLDAALDTPARLHRLHVVGTMLLVTIVVSTLLRVVKDYRQRLLNARVALLLRRALLDRLLHLSLRRLRAMTTGGVLSRLTGDVDTTAGLLQTGVVAPATSGLRLILAGAVLLTLNWRLAVTALIVLPGAMLISFVAAQRIRPIYRSVRTDADVVDGRVGETLSGIRVVRAFRNEAHELLTYLRGRHTVLRKEMFANRRELALWAAWGLLVAGFNVAVAWFGGYLNVTGRATIGDIMAFQWYAVLLLSPAWDLVASFADLQRSLAATERVFEVLGAPADQPDRADACDAPSVVSELRFEDVTFAYPGGSQAVQNVDLIVPGGSVIALVGRSGAGKTTFTDLVTRLQDPIQGRILLNGIDIRYYRLKSYRSLLAVVPQDVFLFDGSVRDNIAYGCRHASQAAIEQAALLANAHEFIRRLPQRYDTPIGERGFRLSGGQQQRLAIARAILASPQILVLDEATSNLDSESEQLIQASMSALLSGRTTFVIAHRLSTIRRADVILLMEDGCIIERGTHESLMAARGTYWRMVRRQVAFSSADDDLSW